MVRQVSQYQKLRQGGSVIPREGRQLLSAAVSIVAAHLKDSQICITCLASARVACDYAEEQEIEVGPLRRFLDFVEAIAPFVTYTRQYNENMPRQTGLVRPTHMGFECGTIDSELSVTMMQVITDAMNGEIGGFCNLFIGKDSFAEPCSVSGLLTLPG